jgi:hypothetical protein
MPVEFANMYVSFRSSNITNFLSLLGMSDWRSFVVSMQKSQICTVHLVLFTQQCGDTYVCPNFFGSVAPTLSMVQSTVLVDLESRQVVDQE